MPAAQFRKRQTVDAIQWTGHNNDDVGRFCGNSATSVCAEGLRINTYRGAIYAAPGDWIVTRRIPGDFECWSERLFSYSYARAASHRRRIDDDG